MNRRDFLQKTLVGAAVAAAAPWNLLARPYPQGEGLGTPGESNPLRLSFQENTAPGETLAERLDYMEAHCVTGFEPGGKNLSARVGELKQALRGRNISVSAICAGFSGFILSEQPEVRAEFDRTMREIIARQESSVRQA